MNHDVNDDTKFDTSVDTSICYINKHMRLLVAKSHNLYVCQFEGGPPFFSAREPQLDHCTIFF